jgi:hypothetical protein
MNDGVQGMSTMLHEAAASKNSACVRLLLASPLLAPHALQMVDEVGYIHCANISHLCTNPWFTSQYAQPQQYRTHVMSVVAVWMDATA